jgi:CBS domain-containing protein
VLVIELSGAFLVRDVMTKAVKTVGIDDLVKDAAEKMTKFNIGSVVVMDIERKKPIGIITERDVLTLVTGYPEPLMHRVRDVMSQPLVTVDSGSTIEETARLMAEKHVKRLPVIENDRLVGIVTSSDIVRASPIIVNILMDLLKSNY